MIDRLVLTATFFSFVPHGEARAFRSHAKAKCLTKVEAWVAWKLWGVRHRLLPAQVLGSFAKHLPSQAHKPAVGVLVLAPVAVVAIRTATAGATSRRSI